MKGRIYYSIMLHFKLHAFTSMIMLAVFSHIGTTHPRNALDPNLTAWWTVVVIHKIIAAWPQNFPKTANVSRRHCNLSYDGAQASVYHHNNNSNHPTKLSMTLWLAIFMILPITTFRISIYEWNSCVIHYTANTNLLIWAG